MNHRICFRRIGFVAVCLSLAATVRSQGVEEILERSARAISNARSFSGHGWGYTVTLSGAPGRVPVPMMMQFTSYEILRRAPDEWLLVRRQARDVQGRASDNDVSEGFIHQEADGGQSRGYWDGNGNLVLQDKSPRAGVSASISAEIERTLHGDPNLSMFSYWARAGESGFSWDLTDAALLPDDHIGRLEIWHIVGRGPLRKEVHLWLAREDLMPVRSVVVQRMGGGIRSLSEWNYDYLFNPENMTAASFRDPKRIPHQGVMSVDALGLSAPDMLLTEFQQSVLLESSQSEGVTQRAAPVPTPKPARQTMTGQKLSAEQMAAIVLIESGDGQASGFMTKMKGVDFVVTNLHVLGPDPQLTLRNLNGDALAVQGIFGAVGRDVAIMRVGQIGGELPIADNILSEVQIGDEVVVVGNRQGGRVATQVEGKVLGIGPGRIEVDAPFEPGNSGSPVVHIKSGKVIGVATYSEKRKVDNDEDSSAAGSKSVREEQRWFAYRLDGITQWEAIDLNRWRAQYKQLQEFLEDSEALYAISRADLGAGKSSPRIRPYVDAYEEKAARYGASSVGLVGEVQNFLGNMRGRGQTGMRELKNGDFYDYFRTSLYWKTSIKEQLDFREWILERLDRMNSNVTTWRSQMRNGYTR